MGIGLLACPRAKLGGLCVGAAGRSWLLVCSPIAAGPWRLQAAGAQVHSGAGGGVSRAPLGWGLAFA